MVRLWEAGALPHPPHTLAVTHLVFAPEGKRLYSGSRDGMVKIWDVARGQARATWPMGQVSALALSPDGRTCAVSAADRTIELRDSAKGQVQARLYAPEGARISAATFSPDGKLLLALDGRRSELYPFNVETRERLATHSDWGAEVAAFSFAPDGRSFAVATSLAVSLSDLLGREARKTWSYEGGNSGDPAAFSPDYATVAVACDREVRLLDTRTGEVRGRLELPAYATGIAFSPDGGLLVTADESNVLQVWDLASRRRVAPAARSPYRVVSVVWSPDGKALAMGDHEGRVIFWKLSGLR